MARSHILSNGELAITLDECGLLSDIFFPYVGLENHTYGKSKNRVGVYIDGTCHWIQRDSWQISDLRDATSLCCGMRAKNQELNIEIDLSYAVAHDRNTLFRHFVVRNGSDRNINLKLMIGQEMQIGQSTLADTAFFDPTSGGIIHYSSNRAFLFSGCVGTQSFENYTTGLFNSETGEGSYLDAETGNLSGNTIEHGATDSVLQATINLAPRGEQSVHSWIVAGTSVDQVRSREGHCSAKLVDAKINDTRNYWSAWTRELPSGRADLSSDVQDLYVYSALQVRAHTDSHGAIIAALDNGPFESFKDTYQYCWIRDASYCACALNSTDKSHVSEKFYLFCKDIISSGGYFMHKYLPNGALGSSWHPWLKHHRSVLPIQVDETAVVLTSLYHHYQTSHNIEFIQDLFQPFIRKIAGFLSDYRDPENGLPKFSYDVWEQDWSQSVYTASSVYAGLSKASLIADMLGYKDDAIRYKAYANEVRYGILHTLYDPHSGSFKKRVEKDEKIIGDGRVDMSTLYGLIYFDVLPPTDQKILDYETRVRQSLKVQTRIGGYLRFEDDPFLKDPNTPTGNPWILTTLWFAYYLIRKAMTLNDLEEPKKLIEWTLQRSSASGLLPEQVHPETGESTSVEPLAWSHAAYIDVVNEYKMKYGLLSDN